MGDEFVPPERSISMLFKLSPEATALAKIWSTDAWSSASPLNVTIVFATFGIIRLGALNEVRFGFDEALNPPDSPPRKVVRSGRSILCRLALESNIIGPPTLVNDGNEMLGITSQNSMTKFPAIVCTAGKLIVVIIGQFIMERELFEEKSDPEIAVMFGAAMDVRLGIIGPNWPICIPPVSASVALGKEMEVTDEKPPSASVEMSASENTRSPGFPPPPCEILHSNCAMTAFNSLLLRH